jgi:uncharacterized protein
MSHHVLILQIKKQLQGVEAWLDKAVAHGTTKKFDPNTLLQARLAPDMFPFVRQVQSACDSAKYAASRTAGKEPPSHPDNETTIDDLKKRVASVVAYLDTFKESDFDGADDRLVSLPRWEGKSMTGTSYLVQHAMPNFFFHLTTTYAILRHNGVEVGKRDYLGTIEYRK